MPSPRAKATRVAAAPAGDVRGAILAGAARVFAQKGAADTTVEDLLRASGVARRTFYRLFASKDDVLDALFELATTLLVDAVVAGLASAAEPAERLARCVDAYLDVGQRFAPLMLVLQGEAQRPDSRLAPRRRAVLDTLADLLAREVQTHEGRAVDRLAVLGALLALEGMNRLVLERGAPTRAELARARQAMLRLVVASLAPEDPPRRRR